MNIEKRGQRREERRKRREDRRKRTEDRRQRTEELGQKREKAKVAVIMGSSSDLETMQGAVDLLNGFGISYEVKVLSAHRSPRDTAKFASGACPRGIKVIIAGAGGAAHLAGVIAAHTTLPVIGVPMETKALGGIDSLFSTVQMPAGVPVATMAIGKSGAKNAAILAAQMLAVTDKSLERKLILYKAVLNKEVQKANNKVKK